MSRPRLTVGTYGDITTRPLTSGRHRARARYRDWDGQVRPVQATGATPKTAERELKAKLAEQFLFQPTFTTLTADSLFEDLVAYWLDDLDLSATTSTAPAAHRSPAPTTGGRSREDVPDATSSERPSEDTSPAWASNSAALATPPCSPSPGRFALAGQVPAPARAEPIGIADKTATKWAALATRDWSEYVTQRDTCKKNG